MEKKDKKAAVYTLDQLLEAVTVKACRLLA